MWLSVEREATLPDQSSVSFWYRRFSGESVLRQEGRRNGQVGFGYSICCEEA
jgi:hypothetical protein